MKIHFFLKLWGMTKRDRGDYKSSVIFYKFIETAMRIPEMESFQESKNFH